MTDAPTFRTPILDDDDQIPLEFFPQQKLNERVEASVAQLDILTPDRAKRLYGAASLIVTSDGAVKGDGATNDSDALRVAVSSAAAFGARAVFPKGRYMVDKTIPVASGAHIEFEPGAEIVAMPGAYAAGGGVFHGTGTDGAKSPLVEAIAKNAHVVTLPSALAGSLAAGDIVAFQSDEPVFGASMFAGEMHRVLSVSGTSVTLDTGLKWGYGPTNSAKAWRIEPIRDVTIDGFRIASDSPNTVIAARGVAITKGFNIHIRHGSLRNAAGGIYLLDVLDFAVDDIDVDRAPNLQNFQGYGVTIAGMSAAGTVTRIRGRYCRHVFTTLGGGTGDGETGSTYGGPRDLLVSDSIGQGGVDTYSIFDTHPQGIDIVFADCIASGGTGVNANGYQVRALNVTLRDCKSLNVGARSVAAGSSTNVLVQGGEFAGGGLSTGIGGVDLGVGGRITHASVHDNKGAGVSWAGTVGVLIGWCDIRDNTYGVQDQSDGTVQSTIVGNYMPKGATTQAVAVLSPKGATVIVDNTLTGYGAGSDGIQTPAATVVRMNNTVDGNIRTVSRIDIDPGNAAQAPSLIAKYGGVEAFRIRRGSAADDAVLAIPTGRKLQVLGGTTEFLATAVKLGATTDVQVPTGAPADAATPAGYMSVLVNGVNRKIPYYS